MNTNIKAYDLFNELCSENHNFKKLIDDLFKKGKIRYFADEEWQKIESQNYMSPTPEMNEFKDMFILGYNRGNCEGASIELSYAYDDVDIVFGILPILKGTLNAEQKGGHCWLETNDSIIDTSLMLVIDKSCKDDFGYIEEKRFTAYELSMFPFYQVRKKFANDKTINNGVARNN